MYYLVSETKGVTAKQKLIVLHPKMNSLQKKISICGHLDICTYLAF